MALVPAQRATCGPAGMLELAAPLAAADLTPELEAETMTVLLLCPNRGLFIPVGLKAELRGALPHARLHVVPRAEHGLPFSHAPECTAELARFQYEAVAGTPER